ncbi:MAG: glycosyltransferase, partial [Altibacter sp.]|nr:glycosyltransferase [Altibacter sp.]
DKDERIITHISNLRPVKRVMDVIEIFDRIQKKIPAKLIMVGEGPEKEACEALCAKKGIQEKVLFLGNSSEINKILCFTDLFLLPSEKESFGLAALEAMACGVPVISSNTGGLAEVNVQGVSGYLSDVGNVDEMATNALQILKDDKTLAQFKKQAKEASRKFDTKNVVPLYETLYEKAFQKI